MADETNGADENVENQPEKTESTVKKRVAKKKAAKKKVAAKKRVATTKKVVSKKKAAATKTVSSQAEAENSSPVAPVENKEAAPEAKEAATPATLAADADAQASETQTVTNQDGKAPSSNVVVQVQLQDNDKTSEETSMSTESKSSGGFWIKTIFWLIIIILGFMYIRSLAKGPAPESTSAISETAQHEVADSHAKSSADEDSSVASTAAAEETAAVEPSNTVAEANTSESASSSNQEGKAVPEATQESAQSATRQVVTEPSVGTTAVAVNEASESTAVANDQQQNVKDMHKESVTKILKEFDDLRDAAQAEMEAKQNRMQAERALHDAMMPPAPRRWNNPGYAPYGPGYGPGPGPYQGYYNYR